MSAHTQLLNSDHFMVTADIFSHSNARTVGTGSHFPTALNCRKANLPALADHLSNALESYDQSASHSITLEKSWSELNP